MKKWIKTIEQYQKNKADILKQIGDSVEFIGDSVMSPRAIADIIDVPMREVREIEELSGLAELDKLSGFDDSLAVEVGTTLNEMFEYGISNLLFVYYFCPKMNYFFVMDNNKSFRVRHGELMAGKRARPITEKLLSVFEKYKIEELKDRATWIPINERWEILDL